MRAVVAFRGFRAKPARNMRRDPRANRLQHYASRALAEAARRNTKLSSSQYSNRPVHSTRNIYSSNFSTRTPLYRLQSSKTPSRNFYSASRKSGPDIWSALHGKYNSYINTASYRHRKWSSFFRNEEFFGKGGKKKRKFRSFRKRSFVPDLEDDFDFDLDDFDDLEDEELEDEFEPLNITMNTLSTTRQKSNSSRNQLLSKVIPYTYDKLNESKTPKERQSRQLPMKTIPKLLSTKSQSMDLLMQRDVFCPTSVKISPLLQSRLIGAW